MNHKEYQIKRILARMSRSGCVTLIVLLAGNILIFMFFFTSSSSSPSSLTFSFPNLQMEPRREISYWNTSSNVHDMRKLYTAQTKASYSTVYRRTSADSNSVFSTETRVETSSDGAGDLNRNICRNSSIEVVICVPISRKNKDGRQTIRETWGSLRRINGVNLAFAFFIGSGPPREDSSIQSTIDNEVKIHSDIIQGSFVDSYNNLTLKSIFLLKWVTQYCNHSRFVLKADDDMYINIPLLIRRLQEVFIEQTGKPFVLGSVQHGAVPQRGVSSKWRTSREQFPGNVYPDYCSGTAYAMSREAAVAIAKVTSSVKFCWMEDIYITGMCTQKARVPVVNDWRFTYQTPRDTGVEMSTRISGHRFALSQIRRIHQELIELSQRS